MQPSPKWPSLPAAFLLATMIEFPRQKRWRAGQAHRGPDHAAQSFYDDQGKTIQQIADRNQRSGPSSACPRLSAPASG